MTSFRSLDRDGLDGVLPAPEVPPPTKNFLAWIVLIFILLAVISSWLWSENIKSTVTENSLSNDQKALIPPPNLLSSEPAQIELIDTELNKYDTKALLTKQNIEKQKETSDISAINSESATVDIIINSPPPSAGSATTQQPKEDELTIVSVETKKDIDNIIATNKHHTLLFKLSTSKIEFLPVEVARDLINFANQCADKIMITGHTCNKGPVGFNYQLGLTRSNAVRHYLIEQGITADVLFAQSKGMNSPIANNTLWSGRKQNRRVELVCFKD